MPTSIYHTDNAKLSGVRDLDCVIVTFDSAGIIDGCLDSLLEAGVEESRIYVVDNGSTDETVSYVSSRYPEVHLLQSSTNLGFSKANNLGAREGSSGRLLFANPDVIFQPGAVEELIRGLDSGSTGICGPLLVDEALSPKPESYLLPPSVSGTFLLYTYLWKPVYRVRRLIDQLTPPGSPRKRAVLSGACMAVRREDFMRVGGFDEEFFMYAEDMDLCERISRSGLEVVQLPEAKAVHLGGGTYSGSRTVLFNSLRSRDLLITKHSGPVSLVAKRAVILLGLSLRLAAYSLLQRAGRGSYPELISNLREGLKPFLSRKMLSRQPLEFPTK